MKNEPVQGAPQDRTAFYQSHLDRVSRSFAFCIARLEGTLRERVGLSYLLCRVLDTIEDANWLGFDQQRAAFERFDEFMKAKPTQEAVVEWRLGFPGDIPPDEARLLDDAHQLFSDFHALSGQIKAVLESAVLSMSAGMRYYMKRKASKGKLILINSAEVNRYCFFVAGVVGEILTRFVSREVQPSPRSLRDGFRFGLFLQKVNLLKDQAGDEQVGRYLVPSRSQVLASLLRDADAAFRYIRALPEKNGGFRLFCAWSLFLGLASLPWIHRLDADGNALKIPREETMELLAVVEKSLTDERALSALYRSLKSLAPAPDGLAPQVEHTPERPDEEEAALLALYRGDLPEQDVLHLFRAAGTV